MTAQTLTVFAALLSDPKEALYGLEISMAAGIKSGVIYPTLARLERAGWVESQWEDVDPSVAGRPRRRLYRLTAAGAEAGQQALAEHVSRLQLTLHLPLHGRFA